MKYAWTTARGAKIILDIDTEVITEEIILSGGWEVTVPCHRWQYTINSLLIDGQERKVGAYKQQIGRWPNDVHYAFSVYENKEKQNVFVPIPDEIEAEIYGAERSYKKTEIEKELAVYAARKKDYDAIMKMMAE